MIRPGEVNLMTAGRGIAHSERTPPEDRASSPKLYGLQTWLALPKAYEEVRAGLRPSRPRALPTIEAEGKRVRLILGALYGERSPVATLSETIYAEAFWRRARSSRSTPSRRNAPSMSSPATSTSAASLSPPAGCSCLRPGDRISIRA